jgi:hypothetical protein
MTTIEAQTQVGCGLFLLKLFLEELKKPLSPIEAAINASCGRDKFQDVRGSVVEVLNSIIEAKTFLGLDCMKEKQMIQQIYTL